MSDWNPTMVTRDGEEIEPSKKFQGEHYEVRPSRQRDKRSSKSDIHANDLVDGPINVPDYRDEDEDYDEKETTCPDCGRECNSPAAQQACMRSHARNEADRLEHWANINEEDQCPTQRIIPN